MRLQTYIKITVFFVCLKTKNTIMITDSQTNKVYFSKRITWYKMWPALKEALDKHGVPYVFLERTRDKWVRDYMPIQMAKDRFVSYVYDPDYLQKDRALITDWETIPGLDLPGENVRTRLIIDGGNVVKCADGVIMTDKVFLENRRLQLSRKEVMEELERLFGKVVILPWNIGDEWDFCGHADGMVRYVGGNRVLVNNLVNHPESAWQLKEIHETLSAAGMDFEDLDYGRSRDVNDWAYLNFLQVGDVIFMPTLDKPQTDRLAAEQISAIYGCEVVPIPSLSLVKANGKYGGGALNCISWNIAE